MRRRPRLKPSVRVKASGADNTRDNFQIAQRVHIVHTAGRFGRSGTQWTDLTPEVPVEGLVRDNRVEVRVLLGA